ncbi:hypothetical protein ACH4M4_04930 [Streptomyces sp. NPDC017254]|uniref:hypothetical protein n=1 Tax=unclassified Streptomyces TaxID=2593676 RepID=UPI0037AC3C8F
MPAPSTAAGQTPTVPAAALGAPRGRRRAPVLSATGRPDPDHDPGTAPAVVGVVPVAGPAEQAGDVVRWAAFCCVLVPVVLVVCGTSLGGAAGTALGLVSVTTACRVLLRRSERGLRGEGARGRRRG